MKNVFNFILKAVFVLKIFKFLSQPFSNVGKIAWLEGDKVNSKIHVDYNLVYSGLQYTYCPKSRQPANQIWSINRI